MLSWDMMGYYLYLPATFIYGDLLELKFIPQIMETYQPSSYFYQAHSHENGNQIMSYTLGLSIFYFPFFLLGHLIASLSSYPADGFSLPYQFSIYLGGGFYSLLGLALIRHLLKRYFTDGLVAATLFILIIGTNYFHYSLLENPMAHTYLFMLYAWCVYLSIKWYEKHQLKHAILLGFCIGLAILLRPSEIVMTFIPILWGITNVKAIKERLLLIWQYKHQLGALVFTAFLVGMLQFTYWKLSTGDWVYYSYGNIGFDFLHPHLSKGLIGIRKGWLVYTPVMALALLGFIPFYKKYKPLFWPFLLYIIANIYFVFSWDVWWYGGSFGCRALVQSYAILLFPLCSFLSWIWSRKLKALRYLTAVLVAGAMLLNLFQDWQYRHKMFSSEGMNPYVYKLIFGKTKIDKQVIKQFEYKDIFAPAGYTPQQTLFQENYATTNISNRTKKQAASDSISIIVNKNYPFLTAIDKPLKDLTITAGNNNKEQWIRASVQAWFEKYLWNYSKFSTLVIRFESADGTPILYRHVKLNNLIGNHTISKANHLYGIPKTWDKVWLDVKIPPSLKATDYVKIYVHNPHASPMFIDDFEVQLLQK